MVVCIPSGDFLTMCSEVAAEKAERGVVHFESNSNAAFVAHHPEKTGGHARSYVEKGETGVLKTREMEGLRETRAKTQRKTPTNILEATQ